MPPCAPIRAVSARSARATRSHARSSCSARCSAKSSSSRKGRPGLAARARAPSGPASEPEYETAVEQILAITGRAGRLDNMPVLQRSIELRNPYVDSLSELQVMLLARLRALPAHDAQRVELLRLVHLTVSGVAAGLQNTG